MASEATLKMLLLGEDRSAGKTLKGVGRDADDTGGRLEKMGKTGDKAFGLLAVAGGAAIGNGLAFAISAEAANDKLAAQLGVGAQRAGELGKVAGSLYSNAFGDSLEQVNEAIRLISTDISGMADVSDEKLERVSGKVLAVASTFDQDLGGVTRAISNLMRNGLAPDSEAALDLITKGLQNGTDKADDLLDTFNEYGTMFRELGINGGDALGLMGQGLQAGARDADTVADALKEFAIRAQDGSDTSADGFKLIGLNAKQMTQAVAKGGPGARKALDSVLDGLRNMEDPAKKNAAAVALFGTKAEDLSDALYALDLDTAADGLGKVKGAAQGVSDTVADNAETSIKAFGRELQVAFVDILGNKVIPFIEEHKTLVEAAAIAVGVLTGAVLAVSAGMKVWAAVTKIVTGVAKAMAVAQWLVNAALSANPIGLVVIAIAALVAGLIIAYKKSETFRAIVDGAFKGIAAAAKFMWDKALKPIFKLWLNTWFTVVGALLDGAAKAFGWVPGLGGKLKSAAKEFDKFRDNVNASLDGIKDKEINLLVVTTEQKRTSGQALNSGDLNNLLGVNGASAVGGRVNTSGWRLLGEHGPEVGYIPAGSQVYSNTQSARMMGGQSTQSAPTTVQVHFNGVVGDRKQAAREIMGVLKEYGVTTGAVVTA